MLMSKTRLMLVLPRPALCAKGANAVSAPAATASKVLFMDNLVNPSACPFYLR